MVCYFVQCGLYLEHFQTWQTGDGFRLEFEQMPNLRYILMKMINSFRARQHHNPQVWSITVTSTAQMPSFTKTDSLQKGFCRRYCLCADLFSSELKVAALQTNCPAVLATFHQILYVISGLFPWSAVIWNNAVDSYRNNTRSEKVTNASSWWLYTTCYYTVNMCSWYQWAVLVSSLQHINTCSV